MLKITKQTSLEKHIIFHLVFLYKINKFINAIHFISFELKKHIGYSFRLFLLFVPLLSSSCINSSKLICFQEKNEGVEIHGRIPWILGFFFIPTSTLSCYHRYNSLYIDYTKIKSTMLDNINIDFAGRKINLGTVKFNDVLDIYPMMSNCDKTVKSHCYDWKKEKDIEISFCFNNSKNKHAIISFFFDQETKQIKHLDILFPMEMDTLLKFENVDKSLEAFFPFDEYNMLLIFGERTRIYKDYSF